MNSKKLLVFFLLAFSALTLAQQRVAFTTSVSGDADLSSWPDAGVNTGLSAGDAICQSRATAAGLDNAANFVALLSDFVDDAYCRLNGLTGKKSDLCGLISLPEDAGPWMNTKAENFAESLPMMLHPNNQVYRSLKYDEFGEAVNSRYFTGSRVGADLVDGDEDCSGWTANSSEFVRTGSSQASASGVLSVGSSSCSASIRLACFETGAGDALVAELPTGSLAFVTQASGSGDFNSWPLAGGENGLEAADQICQSSALNAGMPSPEAFIAWISDDLTDAIDRFEYSGPWFRQDGVIIAHDMAELFSGELNAPINLTENTNYLGNNGVWTGTDAFGIAEVENCQNWQSANNADDGRMGSAHFIDVFSSFFIVGCDFTFARLYCLHNVDIDFIFENGFE